MKVISRILGRYLLIILLLLTNGCMSISTVEDAKGNPQYSWWPQAPEKPGPHPAYYAWLPLTVPADIATAPLQGIGLGLLYLSTHTFGEPDTEYYPPFTNTITSVSDEVLSNSLAYYVVFKDVLTNGYKVDWPDFGDAAYIHAIPEVLITNIISFSLNLPKGVLYEASQRNEHVSGMREQPISAFSISLFAKDANNVARLEQAYQTSHDFLFMLNNRPLAGTYLFSVYDPTIGPSFGPRAIYLPLRQSQDILEISNALQRLVHKKR